MWRSSLTPAALRGRRHGRGAANISALPTTGMPMRRSTIGVPYLLSVEDSNFYSRGGLKGSMMRMIDGCGERAHFTLRLHVSQGDQ